MSAFVLDCSIAVAWLFDDEAAPEADALLDRLKNDSALVPGLWHLEIGNPPCMSRAPQARQRRADRDAPQNYWVVCRS